MAAELNLQERQGSNWSRGLGPMLRRENRKWWRSRRWLVQMLLWVALLDGVLALVLFMLPQLEAQDGGTVPLADAIMYGRQMFFGMWVLATAVGAVILMQDVIIIEKESGTAEWVLSKPLSRTAYVLSKLLPNLLGMAITMLLIPGIIGYGLFYLIDPSAVPINGFLIAVGIVALHLTFYVTLTLLLGIALNARTLLLGIALGSLLGSQVLPLGELARYTPWLLGQFIQMPVMGDPLPTVFTTIVISTTVWIVLFVSASIWGMNRLEF